MKNNVVFLLSGENIQLAKEEVLSLVHAEKYHLIEKLLIVGTDNSDIDEMAERLAFTKSIHLLLFHCNKEKLIKKIKSFDWNSVYRDNFCIRISDINKNSITNNSIKNIKYNKIEIKNSKFNEKKLAGYIWDRLKKPKVNLENPKTLLTFIFNKNNAYCCLLLKEICHDFKERRSHLRPKPSSTSLHPRLARAMINLTGIKGRKERIADLLCGSGGIPLEAGLMGFGTISNDINRKMLWKTTVNMKHYKIKNYKIMKKDILKINEKFDYVVSDLPYGLNSSVYFNGSKAKEKIKIKGNKKMIGELEAFYLRILLKLRKIAKKKIVLIFPHFVDYEKIIRKSGLELKHDFSIYVHKSLTRKIVVLSPSST